MSRAKRKKPELTIDALVLGYRDLRSEDRICTLLTNNLGCIRVFVNRAKRYNSGRMASSSTMVYSQFKLHAREDSYSVTEAKVLDTFIGLHDSPDKMMLAMYFGQLASRLVTEEDKSDEPLRLTLNCMKFLEKDRFKARVLKAIYELRLLSLLGFLPDLTMCGSCGSVDIAETGGYFCPGSGEMLCGDCLKRLRPRRAVWLSPQALANMRLICYGSRTHIFNVNPPEEDLRQLCQAAESYMLNTIQYEPEMLAVYRAMAEDV